MKFIKATVTRDTNNSHTGVYAPWEIPVLRALHDDGNVVENELVEAEDKGLEAGEEFDRLRNRYGMDKENTKLSYVEIVYGQGHAGMTALAAAMANARATKKRAAKAGADELAA